MVFGAEHGLSLDAAGGGYSLAAMGRILIVRASPVAEHRLEDTRAQQVWHLGLVVLWHVESSWTRVRTCVSCIGRRILNHWSTREVPDLQTFYKDISHTGLGSVLMMSL